MALYIISAKGPKRKIIAIPLILQKDSSFYLFLFISEFYKGLNAEMPMQHQKKRKKHLAKIKPY